MPNDFKGTVNQNIEWGITYWPINNNLMYNFYCSVIFLTKLLSVDMENTLIGQQSIDIKHIWVNNRKT